MAIPNQTQFIKQDKLAGMAIILAWIFGVIAPLLISTHGNYIMFAGGWDGFVFPYYSGNALLTACVYQVVCSAAQFGFKAGAKKYGKYGWWIAYVVSLLISVVPSFIAYYTGFSPRLIVLLTPHLRIATTPLVVATIFLGSLLLDWLPEWISVE